MSKRNRDVDSHEDGAQMFGTTAKGVVGDKCESKKKKSKRLSKDSITEFHRDAFDITEEEHDMAVKLLRGVNWTKCQNTSRRNVIRMGDKKTPKNAMGKDYCHSFIFGKNMKDSTGGLSYWSTEYEELYSFFQTLIGRIHPEHSYTNITVNKNLVCKKHTDGGNTGQSYIVSFGHFTGGRLIIEKKGGGDPRPVDIFRRFVAFNGSLQPHETEDFVGERYSAVFYTSSIVPTEVAPRKRPASFFATASGSSSNLSGGAVAAGGGASAPAAEGASGSAAMKQRFQDMKKKLQGKMAK